MERHMNKHARGHYLKLALMTGLSFIFMYALMYAMVDRFANVYSNLNQLYMAAPMTAPMVAIELALMWPIYVQKQLNVAIASLTVVVFAGCFLAIRGQAGVSDIQFLRSMIPHHSGAILMCEKAALQDADIRRLAGTSSPASSRKSTK